MKNPKETPGPVRARRPRRATAWNRGGARRTRPSFIALEDRLVLAAGLAQLPVSAVYAASEALGRGDASYAATSSGSGIGLYELANGANGYSATVDLNGFRIGAGADVWSLVVRGIGYGDDVRALGAAAPKAEANRVEYDHGAVSQWYVNGPLGLQQGFTLDARPEGFEGGGPLTIRLDVQGLSPIVEPGGTSVSLARGGVAVASYGGLIAYDAAGRAIPAVMTVDAGATISIQVDDADAVYPLVIDPVVQRPGVTEVAGTVGLGFSLALSADGQTMVATTTYDASVERPYAGSAYVFTRDGATWAQTARLVPPAGDAFRLTDRGLSLSADGSAILAPMYDGAYLFVRDGSAWRQGERLPHPSLPQTPYSANAVAISGDGATLAVTVQTSAFPEGIVLYEKDGTGAWTSVGVLGDPETTPAFHFGGSLKFDAAGSTLIVGASTRALVEGDATRGAAYIYEKGPSGWTLAHSRRLTAADGGLGEAIAISADGSLALVGGSLGMVNDPTRYAVLALARTEAGWEPAGRLMLPAEAGVSNFSDALALAPDGSYAVVTALQATEEGRPNRGAAYLFRRTSTGWTGGVRFTPESGLVGEEFGRAVAVAGDTIVVSTGNPIQIGTVYTFELDPGVEVFDGPYDQKSVVGRSATFHAVASAPGLQARWQWQAEGTADWVDVPGATAAATVGGETQSWHTFTATPEATNARFRVVFRDPSNGDVAVSGAALLQTVQAFAKVDFETTPARPTINGPTTFVVHVALAVPGVPVPDGGIVRLKLPTGDLTQPLVDGRATFVVDGLTTPGTRFIAAEYDGDAYTAPSASSYRAVTVVRGDATLAAEVPAQARSGEVVNLTAIVSPSAGGAMPTGGVVFLDGGQPIGFAQLSPSGAAAAATYRTTLAAGDHYFQWIYLGDPKTFAASSAVYKTMALASGSPVAGLAAPLSSPGSPSSGSPPATESTTPDLGADGAVLVREAVWFTVPPGADYESVRWQVRSPGEAAWSDIPGATDARYRLIATADDDGKRFRAVLATASGPVETSPRTLDVVEITPILKFERYDVYPGAGAPWAFLVTARSPIPGPASPTGSLRVSYGSTGKSEPMRGGQAYISMPASPWQYPTPTPGATSYTVTYDGAASAFAPAEHTETYPVTRSTAEMTSVLIDWSPPIAGAREFGVVIHAVWGAPAPTGSVLVLDGGRPIALIPLVGETSDRSRAVIDAATIPPGQHYFQFVYLGDRYTFARSSGVYPSFKAEATSPALAVSVFETTGAGDSIIDDDGVPFAVAAESLAARPTGTARASIAAASKSNAAVAAREGPPRLTPPSGRRITVGEAGRGPWRTSSLFGGSS